MFRTARRITPLLRSLLFGVVATSGATLAAGTVAGCSDENAPETHVKRLGDPATRPAAVTRLIQFFEDAMTRDGKDRDGASVKPLLDKIVAPMAEICAGGDLDERTNSKVVKFLSDARDERAEPCLIKTLKDYRPDATEEDIRWAARAVGAQKSKAAAGALFEVFAKLKPSKPKAAAMFRDVYDAMIAVADPAWENQLITMVNRPIADRKDMAALKDELFWQITSAELLGSIKSEKAVEPLLKMILSPMKADAHHTAILALVKIGKPALPLTISVLKSENKDLVDYATVENLKLAGDKPNATQKKAAEVAHVMAAALVLGTIGRDESAAPLLEAVEKATDVKLAIIARELAKVPKSAETMKAFQTAFEKTPVGLSLPPAGQGARDVLLDSAATFFDASLTPWIVKTALDAKGDEGDVAGLRENSFAAALKLMTKDQVADVDRLAAIKQTGADGKPSSVGKAFEKEYKTAKELVVACGDSVECYLAKLQEPASNAKDTQFVGIKSAYMVGVLGGADARMKLIEAMPKITNAAVRFVSVSVIDHFSPKGDPAIAAKLQEIVDAGEASKDQNRIQGNAPFKQVIYRLTARSQ